MIPISVVVVTMNEEMNIMGALESVKDAAEIVVVDSFSTDKTLEICRRYTDKVFQKEWQGYARQKQMAIDMAGGPWVLILDADERLTDSLKKEIPAAIKDGRYAGFYMPRKNFFLKKWIRHGGWWPDYTLRLFRKDSAFVEEREVHEKVGVRGGTGYLKSPIEHYTYNSIGDYLKRMDVYSALAARELIKDGFKPGVFTLILRPFFTFMKMFFLRQGFRDGMYGLILAMLYSYYTFLKYVKVWEARCISE